MAQEKNLLLHQLSQKLHPQQSQPRRGSFLYRNEHNDTSQLQTCFLNTFNITRVNHSCQSSVSTSPTSEHNFPDEQLVTPFALILQRLQIARNNYVDIHNINEKKKRRSSVFNTETKNRETTHGTTSSLSLEVSKLRDESILEVLDDLDWCLDQLEAIQTHRSFGDLASSKFKKILKKELEQLSESGKSGNQVSQYIRKTFLDKEEDTVRESELETTPRKSCNTSYPSTPSFQNKISLSSPCLPKRTLSPCSSMAIIPLFHQKDTDTDDQQEPSKDLDAGQLFGLQGLDDSQLEAHMGSMNDWNLNIFQLDDMSHGHSLIAVSYNIFKQRNLLNKFQIDARTFLNYVATIENHYHLSRLYHNRLHAADVTNSVHVQLNKAPLLEVFSDTEILSALFASIIHDVDHPGLTNQHLINTNSDLALMYNDESILENHHLAVAFKLLQYPGCDIFQNFTESSRKRIRKNVISMVISTDMSKHMSLLAGLKTMVEARKVSGTEVLEFDDPNERLHVLKCLLHCADLGNPTKQLNIYKEWIDRVMNEFYKQGDIERDLGIEISPMCDKNNASIEKSQVGFIDYVVQPLWEAWAELVEPHCDYILDTMDFNKSYFATFCTVSPEFYDEKKGNIFQRKEDESQKCINVKHQEHSEFKSEKIKKNHPVKITIEKSNSVLLEE